MPDDVTIANMAIDAIGGAPVSSVTTVDPDSKESEVVCRHYAHTRDLVLYDFPWNFATRRLAFGAASSTAPEFGYSFSHPLPNDPFVLRVLRLSEVEYDFIVRGRFLFSDQSTPEAECIVRATDAGAYSPAFVDALVLRLAARMAYPVTRNRDLGVKLLNEYAAFIDELKGPDSQEGTPDVEPEPSLISVRRGYESPLFGSNVD